MRAIDLPTLAAQPSPPLVLCSTARLARALQSRYARLKQEGGHTRWATLPVCTFDGWLAQQREGADLMGWLSDPALQAPALTAEQELLLWEQAIAEDLGEGAQELFDLPALAATAAQANEWAHTWRVPVPQQSDSEESQRFARWRGRFQERCGQIGAIDAARQQATLVAALLALQPWRERLPRCIVWAGFDRYTPQHLRLQQGLAADVAQYALAPHALVADRRVLSYPDVAGECLAVALWAKEELALRPDARLAIVVPNLAAVRNTLQDALEDVLQPWVLRAGYAEAARVFNVSLGLPLTEYPLVRTALQTIELANQACSGRRIGYADFSRLWLDPFAWGQDAALHGAIDAALRSGLSNRCSLAEVWKQGQALAASSKAPHAADVMHAMQPLEALLGWADSVAGLHRPSQWAGHWYTLLEQAGWLRGRACSSHEFQTREAFECALQQFGDLDRIAGAIPASEALRLLRRRCGSRIFQPQTEGDPPVQVLGVLEASGLRFDAAWIMGMVDAVWPPPARPNALLDRAAQRQARAPGASADIELEFARKVHDQLLRCAPRVVLSWPQSAEGADLVPSPLLGSEGERHPTPEGVPGVHRPWPADTAEGSASRWAEPVQDDRAPPVAEGEHVQGGTWLLRAQAVCPAWAFHQYRLHATRLEKPADGLDARHRGTLLHSVLAHFWQAVRSSANLQAWTAGAVQRQVRESIEAALQVHAAAPRNPPLPQRFRALEERRLERLVLQWLDMERARDLPFTVLSCEEQRDVALEGLQIRVIADRIDAIGEGEGDDKDAGQGAGVRQMLAVIDYKTGAKVDFRNWATDRLTEPQLPLYATLGMLAEGEAPEQATRPQACALLFAHVKAREPAWDGLSDRKGIAPSPTKVLNDPKGGRKLFPQEPFPDWDALLRHWREALTAVAREVREGVAAVQFDDVQSLQHCDVRPLLRLPERAAQLEQARRDARKWGEIS